MRHERPRRICFVSGARAEFGLMRSTLTAIAAHPDLSLQLVITGMHLDRSRGKSIDAIRQQNWKIDAVVPWPKGDGTPTASAIATGKAIAALGGTFEKLQSDIILVTGDRVEAFAAAAAGHLSGKIVAHIHGGDRALGLVDDSLRHSITKLSHIHFPATRMSADRIARMGEDSWRIFRTGSPGLDDVRSSAATRADLADEFPELRISPSPGTPGEGRGEGPVRTSPKDPHPNPLPEYRERELDQASREIRPLKRTLRNFAILVLHPQTSDPATERKFAQLVLKGTQSLPFERIVIIYPNNDPGSEGIAACWDHLPADPRLIIRRDLPRGLFLGLLREAAVLVGNSSSGIIEAASFGTPVLDIGHRQTGRERGENVFHAPANERAIRRELQRIWKDGEPIRFPSRNLYGTGGVGRRIASTLARLTSDRFRRKLIAY